jgi:hypothetical protein
MTATARWGNFYAIAGWSGGALFRLPSYPHGRTAVIHQHHGTHLEHGTTFAAKPATGPDGPAAAFLAT